MINTATEVALNAITNGRAKYIGSGPWVKDSSYQVYKFDGSFYAIIVVGQLNAELMEESIIQIGESQIEHYIEL